MSIKEWNNLKEKGFFILKQKGRFKNTPHTSYAIVKIDNDTTRTVRCYVNKNAYLILKNEIGFNVVVEKNIVWSNKFPFMDFLPNEDPAIITFHI